MSRNQISTTKLIAALGAFGLVMGFWAPRVNAQVSAFTNAVYHGRYVCALSSDENDDTAVVKYNTNGAGGYTAGTLIANDATFLGGAVQNFCVYNLDTTLSAYSIDGHGLGFEKLVWDAASTNDGSCPASYTDTTALALRNLTNGNGVVIDAELSDANLSDEDEAGYGYCLK